LAETEEDHDVIPDNDIANAYEAVITVLILLFIVAALVVLFCYFGSKEKEDYDRQSFKSHIWGRGSVDYGGPAGSVGGMGSVHTKF